MSFCKAPGAWGAHDLAIVEGAIVPVSRHKSACDGLARWLLGIVVLLAGASYVRAGEVTHLADDKTRIELSPAMVYLLDAEGSHDINSIQRADARNEFSESTEDTPNFGFIEGTVWSRIRLENQSSIDIWLLNLDYPLLNEVTLYTVRSGVVTETIMAGPGAPALADDGPLRRYAAEVKLQRNGVTTLYIKTRTASSHIPAISLWQPMAFLDHTNLVRLMLGIYYGIVFAMLAYNLMLYFSVRDTAYLYYVGYIFSFGLMLFSANGLASQYLWTDESWWGEHIRTLCIAVAAGVAIEFTRALLDTRISLPRGDRLLRGLIGLCVLLIIVSLVGPYRIAVQFATAVGLVVALSLFVCGFASWRAGVATAPFYLIAWGFFLVGCITYPLMAFGVLPPMFLTQHSIQIGSATEVLLLSFVLAYRIKLLREENERMHNSAKESLEARVAERTEELNRALEKLSAANQQMAMLSQVDKLTGAKNRHYFDSRYEDEWFNATQNGYSVALLLIDLDHFKSINDSYGHVFGDQVLKQVADAVRTALARSMDELVRYGGEEFIVMLPHTDVRGATDVGARIKASVDGLRLLCDDRPVPITISMGIVASVPAINDSPLQLIEDADRALYEAKAGGRNRIIVFPETHPVAAERHLDIPA